MKNKIENIKNIVLWLLFVSSIALVVIRYNLVQYDVLSNNNIIVMSNKYFEPHILPKHINIKSGKYDMTSILNSKDTAYKKISALLVNIFFANNQIKKIEQKEYDTITSNKNITLIYDSIPSYYLEKSLHVKNNYLANLDFIKEIVILQDSIYIKTNTSYNKISFSKSLNNNVFSDISKIQNSKFYTKFENFNTNKNLLLPLSFNMSLSNIYLSDISDTVKVNDIAKYIFEDKLDFTSSMIQSDGLYFYSYNNGNEILKISKSGILEYKKELSETSKDDIKKSTNAMLNFLIKLGINNNDIIIDKVEKINHSSNIIYKFNIKRQKNGTYIYMLENGESENISVSGDTVISANILLKNIGDYTGSSYDIIEPTKAINDKIEYIKNKLNEKDVSTIISKIDDISLVYKKESEIIVPMWLYVIDDFVFFIDAVNGEIYNYAMEKN